MFKLNAENNYFGGMVMESSESFTTRLPVSQNSKAFFFFNFNRCYYSLVSDFDTGLKTS